MLTFLVKKLRQILVHDDWHIGIITCTNAKEIRDWNAPQNVAWLPRAKGVYRADPCIASYDGETALFYEEYQFSHDQAVLMCRMIQRDQNNHITFGDAMPLEGIGYNALHKSYPFVFEINGVLWMIPEIAHSGGVQLYRLVEFPHRWEHVKTIVQDFSGVDATVKQVDGTYWLFVTHADNPNDELHIFWAQNIEGPWTAHKENPSKSSPHNTRSAGMPFVIDNVLYRPTQDCTETYGQQVSLNRVDEISPSKFLEKRVSIIAPWNDRMRGLHTISYHEDSGLVAFDIKTKACLNDVLLKIWAKVNRVMRRHCVPSTFL